MDWIGGFLSIGVTPFFGNAPVAAAGERRVRYNGRRYCSVWTVTGSRG